MMRRRSFITLLGSATIAWPLAARAQQGRIWRVGMLETVSTVLKPDDVGAFRQGLQALTNITFALAQ